METDPINVGDFVVCNCGACPREFTGILLVKELTAGMVSVESANGECSLLNKRNSIIIHLTEDELLAFKLGVCPCLKKDDPRLKK